MRRTRWKSAWTCMAVAVALCGSAVRAGATVATAAPAANLKVVIVGDQATADLLAVAIAPLLTEMEPVIWRQLRVTAPISEAEHPGVARIWIDAHRAGAVSVVGFSRRGTPRARTIDAPELTPVVAETIAQVVHETAVALLAQPGAENEQLPAAAAPDIGVGAPDVPAATATRVALPEAQADTPASPFQMSLALGYMWREQGGYGPTASQGPMLSVTAWYRHPSVRSFATLAVDRLQGTAAGSGFINISAVSTLGISWRPGTLVDLRTSIGAGTLHYSWLGSGGWAGITRAAVGVATPLPAGLEVMLALVVDGEPHFGVSSYSNWEPAGLLAVGWQP